MITASDAKLIAILAISSSSYVAGLLPTFLGLGNNCQKSVVLSCVLCYGGGVLLATSLVHILPDTREALSHWAEVVLSAGFFIIYILDVTVEILNWDYEHTEDTAMVLNNEETLNREEPPANYGTIEETDSQRQAETRATNAVQTNQGRTRSESVVNNLGIQQQQIGGGGNNWNCISVGLLMAFTLHAILEGLVIGIQSTANSVFLLLGAVACHKLVVTFCLGAELSSDGRSLHLVIPPLSLYVIGSAVGIAAGMILHKFQTDPTVGTSIPVLQGLAGGTLLYIVVSEILPRERRRELPISASIFQFLAMLLGFITMTSLTFTISDDPDDISK